MPISIHLPSILAPLASGERTVSLEGQGPTVGSAVRALTDRYPALAPRLVDSSGGPYPFVAIYLNDDDIRFVGGFDAPLSDGDEIAIVPAVAGG
ncbi:MAG: MoaD/ThiS family protein [Gemmatimonadaceae bacterium]